MCWQQSIKIRSLRYWRLSSIRHFCVLPLPCTGAGGELYRNSVKATKHSSVKIMISKAEKKYRRSVSPGFYFRYSFPCLIPHLSLPAPHTSPASTHTSPASTLHLSRQHLGHLPPTPYTSPASTWGVRARLLLPDQSTYRPFLFLILLATSAASTATGRHARNIIWLFARTSSFVAVF